MKQIYLAYNYDSNYEKREQGQEILMMIDKIVNNCDDDKVVLIAVEIVTKKD